MEIKEKILNVTRVIGATVLAIGFIIFFFGLFNGGFTNVTAIGLGLSMGAVFIFLIGLFLVAVEGIVPSKHSS